VFEKVDGGVPDAGLSGEMDRLNAFVNAKLEVGRERFTMKVEASGGVGSSASSGGGILSKLFGGGAKTVEEKTIEIPAKPESRKDIMDVEEIKIPEKIPRKRKT
jgi:hypothetical protein